MRKEIVMRIAEIVKTLLSVFNITKEELIEELKNESKRED